MSIEKLKQLVDDGRANKNLGLQMGLPKLESQIDGLTKSTYYLVAGGTSSGKTAFILYSCIYRPYMDSENKDDLQFIYYSLEMAEEILLAKLLSLYIYEKYDLILSYKQILSRNRDNKLSDYQYNIVKESYIWLEGLCNHLTIYDKGLTANKLYAHLLTELKKYGNFDETEHQKIYHKHNPNLNIIVILDHIGLVRSSEGRSKKEEIDMSSAYLVTIRNRCGIIPVVATQINRDSSSMDRRTAGFNEIELSDLKNSGNPAEDCDVAIALFYPYREKLSTYKNYNITKLGNRFRSIIVLKNRYGEANFVIGTSFYGEIGLFQEMPKAEEISDYDKFTNLQARSGKTQTDSYNKNKLLI